MSGAMWVAAGLLLLILELIGPAFVFVSFAAGAFGAALATYLGMPVTAQLVVFAASSTLLVLGSRTIFRRVLLHRSPGRLVRTNAAALPGQSATVIQAIDNARDQGQVRLHGMEWTARSLDERPIPEGARVRVIQVEGVKLVVDPENNI